MTLHTKNHPNYTIKTVKGSCASKRLIGRFLSFLQIEVVPVRSPMNASGLLFAFQHCPILFYR
jgi:hypothetical protein